MPSDLFGGSSASGGSGSCAGGYGSGASGLAAAACAHDSQRGAGAGGDRGALGEGMGKLPWASAGSVYGAGGDFAVHGEVLAAGARGGGKSGGVSGEALVREPESGEAEGYGFGLADEPGAGREGGRSDRGGAGVGFQSGLSGVRAGGFRGSVERVRERGLSLRADAAGSGGEAAGRGQGCAVYDYRP